MKRLSWLNGDQTRSRRSHSELAVFIHVPKTAGSTFNAVLKAYGPGRAHIEGPLSNGTGMKAIVAGMSWVSGHVTVDRVQRLLKEAEIEADYYTILRRPREQVMSHFNWLIEIYRKGVDFYSSHPPHIRCISEEIRSADLESPSHIASILGKHSGLFLNLQSKYVNYQGDLNVCLDRFTTVATEGDVDALFDTFGSPQPARKNASMYHFDTSVFEASYLVDFLAEHNARDEELYKGVVARGGRSAGLRRWSSTLEFMRLRRPMLPRSPNT